MSDPKRYDMKEHVRGMDSHIFAPAAPEPVSTKGSDEPCAIGAPMAPLVSNAAPNDVRPVEGEQQESGDTPETDAYGDTSFKIDDEVSIMQAMEGWEELAKKLERKRDAALSQVAELTRERDDDVREASRRDEKWMIGINEACGQKINFDPIGNGFDATLEDFIKSLRAQLATKDFDRISMISELGELNVQLKTLQFRITQRDLHIDSVMLERAEIREELDTAQKQNAVMRLALRSIKAMVTPSQGVYTIAESALKTGGQEG